MARTIHGRTIELDKDPGAADSSTSPEPRERIMDRRPVIEVMDDTMAEVLRRKSEVQRLRIGLRMWNSARTVLRASIRSEHPEWDEARIGREVAHRISHGEVPREPG